MTPLPSVGTPPSSWRPKRQVRGASYFFRFDPTVVKLIWAPSKVFRSDFGPKTANNLKKSSRKSADIVVSRGGVPLGGEGVIQSPKPRKILRRGGSRPRRPPKTLKTQDQKTTARAAVAAARQTAGASDVCARLQFFEPLPGRGAL